MKGKTEVRFLSVPPYKTELISSLDEFGFIYFSMFFVDQRVAWLPNNKNGPGSSGTVISMYEHVIFGITDEFEFPIR